MDKFSDWLKTEGFDFVTEPMPSGNPAICPEFGKGGLSDDSALPMNMRKGPITSAFNTYKNPKQRRKEKIP